MNCADFALEAIKEGRIHVTIDVMAYELGYQAVEVADKIRNGEEYEENIIMETEICDIENVEKMEKKHQRE